MERNFVLQFIEVIQGDMRTRSVNLLIQEDKSSDMGCTL